MVDPNFKYGIRPATRWREVCIEHLKHCDDPKCDVRVLMKMWNELGGWKGWMFEEVQSSASSTNLEES